MPNNEYATMISLMLWVRFTPCELKVSVQALPGKPALQQCEVHVQPTHRAVTALMSLTIPSTPNRQKSSAMLAQLPEMHPEIHPENRNRTSRAKDKLFHIHWNLSFRLWVLHKVLDNTNSSSTENFTVTSWQCRYNFFCSVLQHTWEPKANLAKQYLYHLVLNGATMGQQKSI